MFDITHDIGCVATAILLIVIIHYNNFTDCRFYSTMILIVSTCSSITIAIFFVVYHSYSSVQCGLNTECM